MEHHAPHPGSAFEGYYNKFSLPSGAHLAIVVCKVNGATHRANCLSFTYVPRDGDLSTMFQKELFPTEMVMEALDAQHSFHVNVPGIGFVKWHADGTAEYQLEHAAFAFHAKTTSRVPWSAETDTPEGALIRLPLPLHWHVHSLASECGFGLKIPGYDLPAADMSGRALVHQEKNFASSFPSAHMWVQARDGDRGICCAGGQLLGLEAFLLGYRSNGVNLDFRPPFAVRILGYSPFMSYDTDWEHRRFRLSIQSFRQKIVVEAQAPKGTFFSLSPPFPEGHRENYLGQSSRANISIKVYESGWFTPWRLVHEDDYQAGSLEFGAGYYPPAGSSSRIN